MSGLIVGGTARVEVGVGVEGVAGAVSRPDGVEGVAEGVVTAVRLRLVEGLCGPSETTITSFVGLCRGLLARVELSAVGGRARLVAAVGSGRAGVLRCRAVAAPRGGGHAGGSACGKRLQGSGECMAAGSRAGS